MIQKPSRRKNGTIQVKFNGEYYFLDGEKQHGQSNLFIEKVTCPTGKDTYLTYEAALKAYRLKSSNGQRNKRIYRCSHCGYWHFTTNCGEFRHVRPYDRDHEKRVSRYLLVGYDGLVQKDPGISASSLGRFRRKFEKNCLVAIA